MLTIHVWPRWLKEFLLTHPLYKSPYFAAYRIKQVRILRIDVDGGNLVKCMKTNEQAPAD